MTTTIKCASCETDTTDSTHKGNEVQSCPDCGDIKVRSMEANK